MHTVMNRSAILMAMLLLHLPAPVWAWNKKCDLTRCATAVALASTENTTTLKVAVMQSKADINDVGLLMTGPLGVALEPGMRMLVGSKDLKLPFKVCFPDGCQAYMQLTPELLQTIIGAKTAQVQFFAQTSSRALAIDLDMTGLGDAVSKPAQ